MKTKFLRFNKLPRIQTLPSKGGELTGTQDPNMLTSPFKPELMRSQDINELVELAIRRANKSQHKYDYQPRDRHVLVDLPDFDQTEQLPNQVLKLWIAEVCNKVVSCAFNLLSTDLLNYEQTKVSCSEGILRNIVLLVEKYRLSKQQIKIINQHIQQNIVAYLKRKYPMTESSDVNKALDESVKPIDKTEALQNDLLQKSDVVFTYRQDGNYNDLIMQFLNWLTTEIDSKDPGSSKTVYQEFFHSISSLFENVYNQNWMNNKARSSVRHVESLNMANLAEQNLAANLIPNEKYADQVKEYTHYLIGRKIPKNVNVYTAQQIAQGHLMIKSPSILRILTKWCDELWSKFSKKNYFLDREENVRVQEKDGNINTMFMWMKIPLNDLIENEKKEIEKFMSEIQENNFDQQTELLKQELFQSDGFYHIQKIEKVCGKFATKTVHNLHSYIVLYLNRLIHGLLSVSKQLYETKLSTKARWTSPPDLITFKIGDLMRCKCSSKQREILHIYKQLQTISQRDPKKIKIIRVKNRLKLGTNDILINILYKNKYLCQIQLAVKSAQSKFIACSNMFNHYIYELGRTLFGPLTELSSVWMSLDPRAGEYSYIIDNEKTKALPEMAPCRSASKKHDFVALMRPFICSNCSLSYSHSNFFWNHLKCKNDGCDYKICALCRIESEDTQRLKKRLLESDEVLLNACTEIVNRKPDSQKKIPTYGVCIPISSKRIKIQKFKKIEHMKIMTIYGLKQEKGGGEKIILIDELIKKSSERNFLKKYLVFQIPEEKGQNLINITIERAKIEYIIPQKVKDVYKKEKELMSLLEQNLNDNTINIVKGPVSGMQYIKNMELADNALTNINFITENFPNLQRLQLSRNQIANIDGISKLRFIRKLNLRNNQLKALPDELCDLDHLQGLNIRNNQIAALPVNFGNLRLLNKLQSDNNKFTDLPESFKNLTFLKFINLSKNKLTRFPECIRGFKDLKELFFAKNKLGTVPEWISEFKDLITLDLSKTGLSNFPTGLYQLQKLQIFKIESACTKLLPEIGKLSALKELSVQMPELENLPNEIFQLKELENLEIEDCKFTELPDCLSEMKKLVSFSLVNNKLDRLSKQLIEMVRLRDLKIQGQNISELPEGIENLVNLRTLSLNNNKFVRLPPAVLKFSKLYSLLLNNNSLEELPEDLVTHLSDLQVLQVNNNKLKTLPGSLKNARKLKKLAYQNNSLPVQMPIWFKAVLQIITRNNADDMSLLSKTASFGLDLLLKMSSGK